GFHGLFNPEDKDVFLWSFFGLGQPNVDQEVQINFQIFSLDDMQTGHLDAGCLGFAY
ncbi:hypothetical protein ACJX0J_034491, partial [Zea mays]